MAGRTRSKSKKLASKAVRKRATAKPAKTRKAASRKVAAKAPARKKPSVGQKSAAKQKSVSKKTVTRKTVTPKAVAGKTTKPKLLSGGNPQIAKGYGDEPVRAYIASMPDWKREVGRRIDALVTRAVPHVRKAVKWNSPFYGVEDKSWFLSFHCFTEYVKVAFFRGASLKPVPPGESTQADVRYLDIREDDPIDEQQLLDWFKQASQLPGERM
jgi:hypothetical protein